MNKPSVQRVAGEWVTFPGGELEGRRPRALCAECREAIARAASGDTLPFRPRALCFACYRADLTRERAIKAAGQLDTASIARFQSALPFEPVNLPRLAMLKAERMVARTGARTDGHTADGRTDMSQETGRFVDRRRQAQIAARHMLQRIGAGLDARLVAAPERERRAREIADAIHAAELQLPESWIPFVMAR